MTTQEPKKKPESLEGAVVASALKNYLMGNVSLKAWGDLMKTISPQAGRTMKALPRKEKLPYTGQPSRMEKLPYTGQPSTMMPLFGANMDGTPKSIPSGASQSMPIPDYRTRQKEYSQKSPSPELVRDSINFSKGANFVGGGASPELTSLSKGLFKGQNFVGGGASSELTNLSKDLYNRKIKAK